MDKREQTEPHMLPGVASAEGGVVFLDGPGGIAIALSADAAARMAASLIQASEEARRQAMDRD